MSFAGLKPVTGKQRWCGPHALAYVAQVSSDDAARTIREVGGRRAIMTTYSNEVGPALDALQVNYEHSVYAGGVSFAEWQDVFMRPTGLYILLITKHFIVIDAGKVYDNGIHRGKSADEMRRYKVRCCWEILK